jgi:hypothetical protein
VKAEGDTTNDQTPVKAKTRTTERELAEPKGKDQPDGGKEVEE